MSWIGRVTWMSLSGVLLLYLVFLGYSILRVKRHPPAASAEAAKPVQPAAVVTSAAPAVVIAQEPIADRIRIWKGGVRAIEDAARQQRDGKFEEARALLEKALAVSPDDIGLRLALARLLVRMKEYEPARVQLLEIIAADPTALEPRLALAETLSGLAWHEQARQVAAWVLESDPYSGEALRVAAQASLSLDNPDDAINHLRRLVNMNRENKWARSNLGLAYLKTGRTREARKVYEEMIKDDPADSAAHFNLAMCDARALDAPRAVETLARAASSFGDPFVFSWLTSTEFDGIRTTEVFSALQGRLSGAATDETVSVAEADAAGTVTNAP